MRNSFFSAILSAAVAVIVSSLGIWSPAQAQPPGPGTGMMGPGGGMMGGGMGMGQGAGGGMCGGGGMGGGMMGGMGGGMMGGGGMGSGMMGMGGMTGSGMGMLGMLDLTDEQRAKINKIHDEHRRKDWDLLGKMQDEQAKLRDLFDADTPDPKKIGAVYGALGRLQQQMVESGVEAWNRVQEVLTKEQRDEFKQMRRGGPGPRGGYGQGPMPHGGMMGR